MSVLTRYIPFLVVTVAVTAQATTSPSWHRRADSNSPRASDIQLIYTDGVIELEVVDEARLDDWVMAMTSPDSAANNVLGAEGSFLEILYNYFHRGGEEARRYGDPAFTNGNFYLFEKATPPDSNLHNHIDLFVRHPTEARGHCNTTGTPRSGDPLAGVVADTGERADGDNFVRNGVRLCLGNHLPDDWYAAQSGKTSHALHEIVHMFNSSVGNRVSPIWANEWSAKIGEFMLGEPAPAHTCCQIAFAASLYHRGATSVLDIYKGQWKYYKYFLWGAYLFFQFDGGTRSDPDDDLLFRMLTEETWGPPQYRRAHLGLYGLSRVLQNADYNSVAYLDSTRFPQSVENSQEIGQERLKRIFHNFIIALWVNDAGVGEGQYAFDENWNPAERTPIWRDVQKGGNAAVVPPNLWLGPEGANQTRVARDEWIDPHDGDTRPLAMWAWSHELMNFQASPDLDTSGDLKIRISQVDSLMTSTDDAYSYDLRASLVAYDVADTNLYRRGDHVLFVQDLETVVPTAFNDSLLVEVTVPDFGSRIKAASIVMSMTEHNTPADSTAMLAIPNAKLEVVKYKVEYTLVD